MTEDEKFHQDSEILDFLKSTDDMNYNFNIFFKNKDWLDPRVLPAVMTFLSSKGYIKVQDEESFAHNMGVKDLKIIIEELKDIEKLT